MTLKTETTHHQPNKLFLWVKRIFAGLLLFWLVIYLLIWSLSPVLIRWQVNQFLQPLNLSLSDKSSIRVNPFMLRLSLSDIELSASESPQILAGIRSAQADIDAFDLFNRVIRFEQFDSSGIIVDARRTVDFIEIAGWQLANQTTDPQVDQPKKDDKQLGDETDSSLQGEQSWRVNAELINLKGISFNIDNLGHSHQIEIKQLVINSVDLDGKQQKLAITIKLLVDSAPIELNADFYHHNGQGQLAMAFKLEGLNLEKLAYLVDPSFSQLSGNFSSEIAAKINFDKQQFSLDLTKLTLGFSQLVVGTAEFDLTLADVTSSINDSTFLAEGKEQSQQLTLDLAKMTFGFSDLVIGTPEFDLTLANVASSINDSTFLAKGNEPPQMKVNFAFENKQLALKNANSEDLILQFETLDLADGKVEWSGGPLPDISMTSLQLEELKFSQKNQQIPAEDPSAKPVINQPLVQLGKINLQDLNFKAQHLSLETLTLHELIANVSLDKNKQLTGLVLPESATAENSQQQSKEEIGKINESNIEVAGDKSTLTPSITFNLASLKVIGKSHFNFKDNSVSPAFSQNIALENIEIHSIDNRQLNNISDFKTRLKMDAYSAAEFNGKVQIFNDKLNLDLKASVNEFSLPAISPYLSDAMGFEMQSGQFDNQIQLVIKDNIIKGNAELKMRGMQLSSVDPGQGNTLKEQSAMPLNKALGLLMDDKGNLELSLPLAGDISKPAFGVSSFVAIVTKKAIMSAAKSYLMDTFVPYANILSVVMVAGEYMLKVSFEDLIYQPTITAIDDSQQKFVGQFITLLKDKNETQIKVCAFATSADLAEQSIELKDPQRLQKYQQQLLEVARLRGEAFKAWVVDKGGIESSRLLLCKPQIDRNPKAKPRLEFEV